MPAIRTGRILLALAVITLAACAPRSGLFLLPDVARDPGIATETVFVASTRVYEEGRFGNDRLEGLDYTRFEVTVPPDRQAGEVRIPRRNPDPAEDYLVSGADRYDAPGAFRGALAEAIAAQPADRREVMVFIHGFNSSFANGLFRTAQIRHDFDIPGLALHYAWPSAGNAFGYAYDRDSALFARDGLESFLREISAAGASDIILVAHSLGSHLTMEALRQLRIRGDERTLSRISGVILMSPDIDVDVFRSQALRLRPLPQPFFIFTSRRDRALTLSARITGQRARLGNIGTIDDVADLQVTLIDISEFSGGAGDVLNHFTAVTSPAMIRLLSQVAGVNQAFEGDASGQIGLLPGTVLTVQNATQIILSPLQQQP